MDLPITLVHSGVPQASALDMILLFIYIGPMYTIIDSHYRT